MYAVSLNGPECKLLYDQKFRGGAGGLKVYFALYQTLA